MLLLKAATEIKAFNEIRNSGKGAKNVVGLTRPAKAHFAAFLCLDLNAQGVYITDSDYEAKRISDELMYYLGDNVYFYPSKEFEFYKADAKSHELLNQRLEVIEKLTFTDRSNTITVMSLDALLQFTVDLNSYKENRISLSVSDEASIEDLAKKLVKLGYVREDTVEGKGQFAIRGGIVDIFAPAMENPIRIEFFGDEVDSIREFDTFTQVSVENMMSVCVGPANDTFSAKDKETSVLEYFNDDAIIFFDEPQKISERYEGLKWDIEETVKALAEDNANFIFKEKYIHDYYDILRELLKYSFYGLQELPFSCRDVKPMAEISVAVGDLGKTIGGRERFYEELKDFQKNGYSVIFSVSDERQEKLTQDLELHGFKINKTQKILKTKVNYAKGGLPKGFYYEEDKIVIFGEEEIFGRSPKKKGKRKKLDSASKIRDFNDLDIGDYVVHHTHGIGQYLGLDTLEVEGQRHDYLKIKYNGDDILYIPTSQLDVLQKYVGKEGTIRLNRMGGADFARQKNKVKASTEELARELVALYAARSQAKGFAFSADTEWQKSFEEAFPYVETDDQLISIAEVKKDMESERAMDRLLCGDVGYGKTEVALRAAFKAVMDSKQVGILAPTTVLVMQHFNTFCERMKKYPIKIAEISRFKTKKEQAKIVKQLKSGEIDIIIGTHRLLGADIEFRDLGLLVIDEEQRFGVKHKERIKEIKNNVDVLTLSATPIPRTLHMSMINIRDMSVLTEPPENRFPVRTIVMEKNDVVLNDAIRRELSRGGQVYYIHNRIASISSVAKRIQDTFPDARVAFAHGAMDEDNLEQIMMDMSEGAIDILVCTTIIETGLDIPNVNTIIIEDANKMGLSQLYQLKGRVGRSSRRAFAYFTYRPDKILNEVAAKRLRAIKEFTEFGSGFKIAMRDLEIRGAGNILGAEQHGHIDTVGYDMYCELLAQSVSELTGDVPKESWQANIDINIEAYIPPEFIKNHSTRLDIYKKIASIENEEERLWVESEICDRFGDMPRAVENLIKIAEIKFLAKDAGIEKVTLKEKNIICYFKGDMDIRAVSGLVALFGNRFFVSAGTEPHIVLKPKPTGKEEILETVKKLLKEYNKLLHSEEI